MKFTAIIHQEPGPRQRTLLLAGSLAAVLLIGFMHHISGPRFEFHVFFLLPVIIVSWYAGAWAGFSTALFCVAVWMAIDWFGSQGDIDWAAAVFNDLVRLGVFLVVSGLVASLRSVLRREARSARIDPLTQLANRRLFYEEGRIEIGRARRLGEPFTVMFLDLDDFKEVNDSLGHGAGDALLCAVADTLRHHSRASDIVGRLGGDEFAILMSGMGSDAADASATKLRARILRRMQEHGWPVTVSMGVATFVTPPEDLDALVSRADALMYEVKREGKNTIRHEVIAAGP